MFKLKVVTLDGVVFDGEATSALIPSSEGQLTILSSHAALLTLLVAGEVVISASDNEEQHVSISGGIMEVKDDQVVLLATTAERDVNIDLERAEMAKRKANEQLQNAESAVSAEEAMRALARANARIKTAKHRKRTNLPSSSERSQNIAS